MMLAADVKVGERYKMSSRADPAYVKYDEWGRVLPNIFDVTVTEIEDDPKLGRRVAISKTDDGDVLHIIITDGWERAA